MMLDLAGINERLCRGLCGRVRLVERPNGRTMLETPFTFPDGDGYPVYVEPTRTGGIRLGDGGNTLMRLSYETEVDGIRRGARARLLEQVLRENGIEEDRGEFYLESSLDSVGDAVFRFGQGVTRIHDILFLNRGRVSNDFYEKLQRILKEILPPERIEEDYLEARLPAAEDYRIDYHVPRTSGDSLFVFGIANRDKARLTTIILERLLRHDIPFDSLLVFDDQQQVPRRDLARLSNVGGEMVASLDAREDLERKLRRKVA